jgi:hypothetical protein
MKNTNLIILSIFFLINNFIFSNLNSQIKTAIVLKVGNNIITSIDIQNEIITSLLIDKQEINQENIDSKKNYAAKNLINKSIKKSEINKYEIKEYSEKDLQNYIDSMAKNLGTNDLKKKFTQNNINYATFVENYKIELLWNTLIYELYSSQINVNIIEVENEVKKNIKQNETSEELKKIKEAILNKKKTEKLNLFSRSHFSNLENTVTVDFK